MLSETSAGQIKWFVNDLSIDGGLWAGAAIGTLSQHGAGQATPSITLTATAIAPTPTPTLTTWGMILLAGALLLFGIKAAGRATRAVATRS